jgi:precorrin-6B methylase 2
VDFATYLSDLPLLHHWGGAWRTGGFQAPQLQSIRQVIEERFDRPRIIETGAGNSTITFLHLDPRRVVSIAPDEALRDRITAYCATHHIPVEPLDYRVARSEVELPLLAATEERFDVAFIDGSHGWPAVFVDFCYVNMMVPKGGLIFIDDVQLYSVAELCRLLAQQPGYELAKDLGKIQVWCKDTDKRFLPGHAAEPYVVGKSTPA